MECNLFKYKKEVATHYVGCTGKEYLKSDYANHGHSGFYRGFDDLPKDEYPYTIKYETGPLYKFCENCDCFNLRDYNGLKQIKTD